MNKIFLDELPKNKTLINWKKSIGYKVKFIYGDTDGWLKIEDYDGKYLYITYLDNKPFKIFTGSFKKCLIGNLLKLYTAEFKYEIGKRLLDYNEDGSIKRDLIIIDRKKTPRYNKDGSFKCNDKYYKIKCNLCGFNSSEHWSAIDKIYKEEYFILEHNLLKGVGCSCCSKASQIVVEDITSIYKTDAWMIPYIGEECAKTHTRSSNEKVEVVCTDCGRIKKQKVPIFNIYVCHSISCSCGDGYSYGHKYVFNLLEQLKRKFIDNYTFDWCKFYNPYKQKDTYGEYDFILEDKKIIIEVDGDWHRNNNTMSGQTKEESRFLDNEKDRLAEEHGYKMIRISDEGDIKQNIIDSDLNKLFDLSKLNWIKCDKFALNNLVKIACEYKRNNPELTCNDIGEIMKMCRTNIRKYLIKGSEIGWCYYNGKEEKAKSHKKNEYRNKKIHSKPIKILDMKMNLIYMFINARECEIQSENLFGIKLYNENIASVCTGRKKHYKNYIFQHTTKEEYNQWLEEQNKTKEVKFNGRI